LKIAFVINSLEGGGAERVVCTLARHYRAEGHTVVIVTLQGSTTAYQLPADIIVHPLRPRRLMQGIGRLAFLPLAAFELATVLARERPDATLSFLTRSNLAHLLTRFMGNSRPIYISERVDGEAEYVGLKRPFRTLVRRLYPRADHIVAVSEGVRQSLGRMGVPLARISTIHNPSDLAEIKADARLAAHESPSRRPFRIVMAGRLTRQKDYPTMLEALALLRKQRTLDVRLVILGDGPDRPALEAKAHQLGVADGIEWSGWVKNIHAVMARCDVFALTSIYEGFANVLVEAMACGLPVISTDCPSGPAELLEGGTHGFLVPVGDAAAIADAVHALSEDPAVYADYQRRARARAERFDVSIVGQHYLTVLTGHA